MGEWESGGRGLGFYKVGVVGLEVCGWYCFCCGVLERVGEIAVSIRSWGLRLLFEH